jgi:phosphatidylserine/phosphatidylglycerophosphate/cardiolipin synthase-like enzyme
MKSRKKKLKKFLNIKTILILLLAIFVIIGLSNLLSNLKKIEFDGHPKTIIQSQSNFEGQLSFNNIVGQEGILDSIVEQIEKANKTIEIASFSFNSLKVKNALISAAQRGVEVTLILDESKSDQHDLLLGELPEGINRIDRGSYSAKNSLKTRYMHHKFVIIDRGTDQQEMTIGSVNLTTLGEKFNQSFILTTADGNIIKLFGEEFDLLKDGTFGIKKIGKKEYNPWAASIQYPDSFMDIWFSPGYSKHSIKYQIIDYIENAEESLDLMMWYFTDEQIASKIISKAYEGLDIRIIVENKAAYDEDSVVPYILHKKENEDFDNLEVVLDTKLIDQYEGELPEGFSPYIHHHAMIVDNEYLIFGTSNWSLWGFYYNDEANFITNNRDLLEDYQNTFNYFYNLLK